MTDFITQFHFLRPYWLLALIPCLLVFILIRRQRSQQGSWSKVIAPSLLPHLIQGLEKRQSRTPLALVATGWILACIALAGPTWQKIPTPVSKSLQPLVVVIDMSYKMYASDVSPNRLSRVRYKLLDLFRNRQDGLSALVSYAGSAHVIAPLTDDARTLENLVSAVSPDIMPVQGDNPAAGIEEAIKLLEQGSGETGDILLITDSVPGNQIKEIEAMVSKPGHRLSIIGVGSDQGAPIALPRGGFLKDKQGTIIVPQRDRSQLMKLAQSTGGVYSDLTVDDKDLKTVLPKSSMNDAAVHVEREFDQWFDMGYWLTLLLLPLALVGFRKGWLIAVFAIAILPAQHSEAFEWQDLWKTPDQQAMEALNNHQPKEAAAEFERSDWKGEALYQAKDYEAAASEFAKSDTASGYYNQGNALAQAGKLDEALKAYDKALTKNPNLKDAQLNKKLLEELKEQQQNQHNQQGDQNQQDNQKQQDQDKNQQQNQDGQQSQQDQDKDQQQNNQQSSDQNPQSQQSSAPDNQSQQDQEQRSGQGSKDEQKQDIDKQQSSLPSEGEKQKEGQQRSSQPSSEQEQKDEQGQQASYQEAPGNQITSPDQQAIENWLKTIPDDPGGLLRRKFLYQQQQREQRRQQESAW